MATIVSLCTSNVLDVARIQNGSNCLRCGSAVHSKTLDKIHESGSIRGSYKQRKRSLAMHYGQQGGLLSPRLIVLALTKGSAKSSESGETIPSWAKPDSKEPPPWARDEGNNRTSQQSFEVPFYVYLLASAVTAIAAIGSIFEYVNERPVFGLLKSDSVFYTPLLGFFVFTGIPMSAFLWFKSVQAANKASEEQDRRDGFQ
uniref:Dimethylaniline monooxygenase [N-oxide-forming] 1 n=1 Tax=Anthurium amnicola TaxID=1678845 RepID=A0A1D1Y4W4_9ARAE